MNSDEWEISSTAVSSTAVSSTAGIARSLMVTFDMPEDQCVRAAIGAVAVRHGQLDYILRMTVKTLAGLTPAEGLDATEGENSSSLREAIRKLGRQRLGEGAPLRKLYALMTHCKRLTIRRNELMHATCAKEADGEMQVHGGRGPEWGDPPTAAELKSLATDIEALTLEINEARLHGFLRAALDERGATGR